MPSYRSGDATRPEYVNAGEYSVEITGAEETVSKNKNDMIELRLKVAPDGVVLFDHLVFADSSFWKIDAFRASIGEKVVPGEEIEIVADDLIGRTGKVRLIVEDYQGRKRNKVAAWLVPQTTEKGGQQGERPF
jgi:hypothetical protein